MSTSSDAAATTTITEVAAADRHQKDIDHAVAMLISARVSLAAWFRTLKGLCKLQSTLERAVEAAGLSTAIDAENGERVLIIDRVDCAAMEPVCSCIAECGKDGGL